MTKAEDISDAAGGPGPEEWALMAEFAQRNLVTELWALKEAMDSDYAQEHIVELLLAKAGDWSSICSLARSLKGA